MRKAILMLFLAAASNGMAMEPAKWAVVDGREAFTIYADPATIRRTGDMAHMWDMSDAKKGKVLGGVKQSRSFRMEREYDCGKQQVRVLYVSWHADNMGTGDIVGSETTPGSWQTVMLGTIGERLWKIACDVDSRKRF
jgi:hypothetical protein